MDEILIEAATEPSSLLRSEQNARLSVLRNKYQSVLSADDFAAQVELAAVGASNSKQNNSAGLSARLQGTFQFNTHWQSDFAWLMARNLSAISAPVRQTQSEIPSLEFLTLSYGRHRSVETQLGLLNDSPVFRGEGVQPLFSGIAVHLHPVSQKISTQARVQAEFEHGWNTFRNQFAAEAARSSLQRTRPRLFVAYASDSFNWKGSVALEWYSDSDAVLSRVRAQRINNAPMSTRENNDVRERRWRLFTASGEAIFNPSKERTMSFELERVTNTIGRSNIPAWSAAATLSQIFYLDASSLHATASYQKYSSPVGAVPSARLPLMINPGTRGSITTVEFRLASPHFEAQSLQLKLGLKDERLADRTGWLQCSLGSPVRGAEGTESCKTVWTSLAWSLKLPTKL